jgi:hypothetical protein
MTLGPSWGNLVQAQSDQEQVLIAKIRAPPPDKVAEIEDFVDFLRQRDEDRRLVDAATKLSEEAFRAVWDNADDADYDRL